MRELGLGIEMGGSGWMLGAGFRQNQERRASHGNFHELHVKEAFDILHFDPNEEALCGIEYGYMLDIGSKLSSEDTCFISSHNGGRRADGSRYDTASTALEHLVMLNKFLPVSMNVEIHIGFFEIDESRINHRKSPAHQVTTHVHIAFVHSFGVIAHRSMAILFEEFVQ